MLSHDDIALVSPDFEKRLSTHVAAYDLVGIAGTTRTVGGTWFGAGHPYDFMLIVAPTERRGEAALSIVGRGELIIPDAQALDGVFIAARTDVARAIGLDEATFDGFHLYDIDFTFRAWRAGCRLAVCRDLVLAHQSHGSYGPDWRRYERRFMDKFGADIRPVDGVVRSDKAHIRFDARALDDPDNVRWMCDPTRLVELTRNPGKPQPGLV